MAKKKEDVEFMKPVVRDYQVHWISQLTDRRTDCTAYLFPTAINFDNDDEDAGAGNGNYNGVYNAERQYDMEFDTTDDVLYAIMDNMLQGRTTTFAGVFNHFEIMLHGDVVMDICLPRMYRPVRSNDAYQKYKQSLEDYVKLIKGPIENALALYEAGQVPLTLDDGETPCRYGMLFKVNGTWERVVVPSQYFVYSHEEWEGEHAHQSQVSEELMEAKKFRDEINEKYKDLDI